jgi:pimeloyl-ACP methyl ester carboxylesterase
MPAQRATLWHEVHGRGGPVLVLLHGLGATAEVWRGVADLAGGWPGTRLLVDLPGHGRSAPLPAYSYQAHASAVAALLGGRPGPVVVAGHSMGGYVGLLLAGRRDGPAVAAVVGLGIKVRWSAEELEGLRRRAGQPVRWFDGRQEAAARYLRSVGLDGLVEPASPLVDSGIAGAGGRWRLAFDPAASGLGAPDLAGALAAARAAVVLARGAGDPMVATADLAALHHDVRELAGLGHNAHVEDPARVWELVATAASDAGIGWGARDPGMR